MMAEYERCQHDWCRVAWGAPTEFYMHCRRCHALVVVRDTAGVMRGKVLGAWPRVPGADVDALVSLLMAACGGARGALSPAGSMLPQA